MWPEFLGVRAFPYMDNVCTERRKFIRTLRQSCTASTFQTFQMLERADDMGLQLETVLGQGAIYDEIMSRQGGLTARYYRATAYFIATHGCACLGSTWRTNVEN